MKRCKLALLSLLPAAVLLCLRIWQLKTGFGDNGIPKTGAPATTVLLIACAVALLYWLLLSRTLTPADSLPEQADPVTAALLMLGGLAIGLNSIWLLYEAVRTKAVLGMLSGVMGIAAAFCLCVDGGLRDKERPAVLRLVPYLFLLARLVSDFRVWSIDPIILDYCFRHFGLLFVLCGLYTAASFRFHHGHRRLCAFLMLGAVALCITAMAGLAVADLLLYGGLTLTALAWLLRLDAETDHE